MMSDDPSESTANGAHTVSLHADLTTCCSRHFGEMGAVNDLRRLTGGANMETWSFDFGEHELILRRMPPGAIDIEGGASRPVELEAEIIRAARQAGVSAPEVVLTLNPENELGRGFIMQRLEGETLAKPIQTKDVYGPARAVFVRQCAEELARIHATPVEGKLKELPVEEAASAVTQLKDRYEDYGGASVMFEAAFVWLASNVPSQSTAVLLHGDFRLGNLLIATDGLVAILDWELAHLGDPAQDLAYLCAPPWRFAYHEKPVSGLGEVGELLHAYKAASETAIPPERFEFWLIYATLWWGVTCLTMIDLWRTGVDRSLERAVIGRRVSEVELELLLLLEGDVVEDAHVEWSLPEINAPSHDTKAEELATALAAWVADDVLPATKGRDKFQALVALNALGMIERQAAFGDVFEAAQKQRLNAMKLSRADLMTNAATGTLDFSHAGLLKHLRLTALEQLYIDQPKYPGFRIALEKWT